MNDHDAIDAINAALDEWFKGSTSRDELIKRICYITGENSIEHAEAQQ